MTMPPQSKLPDTVGALVRQRLKEIGRSSTQLAEAVQVPLSYIDDLIAGHRRPPLPGRTDIYAKMNSFLRLRRNDVATCALGERGSTAPAKAPAPRVRELFLELCVPATAASLARRRSARSAVELSDFFQRVLDVAQSAVLRTLDDQIAVRLAAAERGASYVEMRSKLLDFLDLTADALTPEDLTQYVRPRIASWDVDLETGVLRVTMRAHAPRDRSSRRVSVKDLT